MFHIYKLIISHLLFYQDNMELGKRGEGWVVFQIILFGILILTTRFSFIELPDAIRYAGVIFLCIGGIFGTAGVIYLGRNLTPFPRPRDSGELVRRGIYGYVRHPVYTGVIFGTFGWSLIISNVLGVVVVMLLFVFFDAKSRQEEKWLVERFPEYKLYKVNVKKLIPWVY